jgi:type I restriction enzyme S subunit
VNDRTPLKYLSDIPITNGLGLSGAFDEPSWPRYIRTTDIADERSLRADVFAAQPPEVARAAMVDRGDVLMTAAGATIGKSYLHSLDGPACYAGYLVRFRANDSCDRRFVAYWMQSGDYWAQIEKGAVRSTIDNFSAGKYRKLSVPTPALAGQRRIADYLDDQTSRIDQANRTRMHQLGLVRERSSSELESVIWRSCDDSIALRRLGTRLTTGPFGTVFAASDYVSNGVPMINPVHIRDGRLEPDDGHTVSRLTAQRLGRHRLAEGDIVTGRKGDIGRSAVLQAHQAGWICGSDAIAIHVDMDRLVPEFLEHALHLRSTRESLQSQSSGATMPSLNEGMLLSVRIPKLDVTEQLVRAHDAKNVRLRGEGTEAVLSHSIGLLEERKRALITAAVTGEFDVTTASGRGVA